MLQRAKSQEIADWAIYWDWR